MKAKADLEKNRLYLKISGKTSKKELEGLYTEIRFCVADLKPGFGVISDLSECNLGHLSGVSTLKKIMNYLVKNGVGEVVRVINGQSLLFKQVLNLSAKIGGYLPVYVSTVEEAEEKLDASMKRNALRFYFNDLPPVDYFINDVRATGRILNLSTGGCTLGSVSKNPAVGEDVLIVIIFTAQDDLPEEFKIKSQVIRTEGDGFAAEFKDLADEQTDRLWQCLQRESEREL
jgi:PilZ domain